MICVRLGRKFMNKKEFFSEFELSFYNIVGQHKDKFDAVMNHEKVKNYISKINNFSNDDPKIIAYLTVINANKDAHKLWGSLPELW